MSHSRFAKTRACPTNESLVQWLADTTSEAETQAINEHLATCEFCELSLELLRSVSTPSAVAPLTIPPVPPALAQLFTAKRETK